MELGKTEDLSKEKKPEIDPRETMIKTFMETKVQVKMVEESMEAMALYIEETNHLPSDYDIMKVIEAKLIKHDPLVAGFKEDGLLRLISSILQIYATITMAKSRVIMEMSEDSVNKLKGGITVEGTN